MFAGFGLAPGSVRAEEGKPSTVLSNMWYFDGRNQMVHSVVNILVMREVIESIVPVAETVENARVINCGGRTVIGGLIDAH